MCHGKLFVRHVLGGIVADQLLVLHALKGLWRPMHTRNMIIISMLWSMSASGGAWEYVFWQVKNLLHVDLLGSLGIFRSTCLTITAQKWVAMVNVNKAILNMRIED